MHSALVTQLAEAASQIHNKPSLLTKAGEFPKAIDPEFQMSADALRFYKNGPPFLQRYVPFWIANLLERLLVLLIPLATIAIPLMRGIPALMKWKVQSKLAYWYRRLERLERSVSAKSATVAEQSQELSVISDTVGRLKVPRAHAEQLFNLKNHVDLVRARLATRPALAEQTIAGTPRLYQSARGFAHVLIGKPSKSDVSDLRTLARRYRSPLFPDMSGALQLSERVRSGLAGADTNDLAEIENEDLAVLRPVPLCAAVMMASTTFSTMSSGTATSILRKPSLKICSIRCPPRLSLAATRHLPEAPDLHDCQSRDPQMLERFADIIQLHRPDDRGHKLHRLPREPVVMRPLSVRPHNVGSTLPAT